MTTENTRRMNVSLMDAADYAAQAAAAAQRALDTDDRGMLVGSIAEAKLHAKTLLQAIEAAEEAAKA